MRKQATTQKTYSYSPMERSILAVFKANAAGKKFSTMDLIEKVYKTGAAPIHARQSVNSVMLVLMQKIEKNKEGFVIKREAGGGPVPNKFWKEMK